MFWGQQRKNGLGAAALSRSQYQKEDSQLLLIVGRSHSRSHGWSLVLYCFFLSVDQPLLVRAAAGLGPYEKEGPTPPAQVPRES